MSTNVKMVGFYVKFETLEEAKNCYRELNRDIVDSDDSDFVNDNYEELFDNDLSKSKHIWIPYFDEEDNLGVIYLIDYEYDAFDLSVVFNHPAPEILGKKGTPFAVLYYNGAECPLILK